jgi:hypothetical protein
MRWRARGFLFPLILIAVGGVALLANLGVLDPDTLWRVVDLWPLLLILLGLEILLSRTLPAVVAGPVMLAVFVLALLGALAYAATASPVSGSRAPFARPLPLDVRTAGSAQVTDTSAPLERTQQGTLRLHVGASRVDIRGESLGEDLFRAHLEFPNGESAPTVTVDSGRIEIDQSGTRRFSFPRVGRRSVELRLNNRVPWTLQLDGGALNGTVDLQDLRLSSLNVDGGAAHLDLRLPPPSGTVRVGMSGGAIDVTLRLPPSTAARVTMDGGANSLSVSRGGRRSGGFGSMVWESDGFASASDRYEVTVSGGANHLRID